MKRIRATLIWEYDVEPKDYKEPNPSPAYMAKSDLETDPALLLELGEWVSIKAEFIPTKVGKS